MRNFNPYDLQHSAKLRKELLKKRELDRLAERLLKKKLKKQ